LILLVFRLDSFIELKNKTIELSNKIGGLMSYIRKSELKGIKFKDDSLYKQGTINKKQQTQPCQY
jgi:hypothetical protein